MRWLTNRTSHGSGGGPRRPQAPCHPARPGGGLPALAPPGAGLFGADRRPASDGALVVSRPRPQPLELGLPPRNDETCRAALATPGFGDRGLADLLAVHDTQTTGAMPVRISAQGFGIDHSTPGGMVIWNRKTNACRVDFLGRQSLFWGRDAAAGIDRWWPAAAGEAPPGMALPLASPTERDFSNLITTVGRYSQVPGLVGDALVDQTLYAANANGTRGEYFTANLARPYSTNKLEHDPGGRWLRCFAQYAVSKMPHSAHEATLLYARDTDTWALAYFVKGDPTITTVPIRAEAHSLPSDAAVVAALRLVPLRGTYHLQTSRLAPKAHPPFAVPDAALAIQGTKP